MNYLCQKSGDVQGGLTYCLASCRDSERLLLKNDEQETLFSCSYLCKWLGNAIINITRGEHL